MTKVRLEFEMQSDADRESDKHNEEVNAALEQLHQSMHDLADKIDKQSSSKGSGSGSGGNGDSGKSSSGGNSAAKDQNVFAKSK